VLSDGADPTPEAVAEVATARELGIAVFFVGFGSLAGGEVHEVDPFNRTTSQLKHTRDGGIVRSSRDDGGMTKLAEAGGDGGRYLVASERGELDASPLLAALGSLDHGASTRHVVDVHDVYQPFLFAAFVLLVVEAAISTRRRRQFPEEV
jgi:hypothetical protein